MRSRRLWISLVSVAVAASGSLLLGEAGRQNTKEDLSPRNLAKLHTLIRPHDHEWRHLRVNWLTDVVAARTKAAVEDKPIVILYTGGAGYNEPLGTC